MSKKIEKTEKEWKEELTRAEFQILRRKKTEPPFSGDLLDEKREGVFVCAGCGNELFKSDAKFDSESGWPSFTTPLDDDHVKTKKDLSHGMDRTEVLCSRCGGHLGHVFDDGPPPGGKRYCINSISLDFMEGSG